MLGFSDFLALVKPKVWEGRPAALWVSHPDPPQAPVSPGLPLKLSAGWEQEYSPAPSEMISYLLVLCPPPSY